MLRTQGCAAKPIVSFQTNADIIGMARTSIADTLTNRFFIAHAAPPKLRQRLHLRPRLLLQIQRTSGTGHAHPLLELLHPGLFGPRVSKTISASERSRMNDMYISRCEDKACEGVSTSEGQDIIAFITRDRRHETEDDVSIHCAGGWKGRASRSRQDQYQCVWQHGDEQMTMESWLCKDGSGHRKLNARLSDDQEVEFASMEGKIISVNSPGDPALSETSEFGLLLDLSLIFLLWISIKETTSLW